MSSELSHGISRLINHPLLLRLLLLHPAGLSSLLALALPPLCPTISCSSRVSWHLPASVSLSWHSQGSFPTPNAEGLSPRSGTGHGRTWSSTAQEEVVGPCLVWRMQFNVCDLLQQGHRSCVCSRDRGLVPKQADKCSLFSKILMIFLKTRPGPGESRWAISGS